MTRECPLREHILAPLEGLRAQGTTKVNLKDQPRGSTPGVREWFQGVLSEKKNYVTHERRTKDERTDGQTDVIVKIVL